MGNEVFFGAPFAAVAKKHSQEPNAQNGGKYDWTTKGSLASEPIDRAIFTLEPGKLSQIIRDDTGLHIVRVIERQDAGHIPFEEAQTGIKEAITNERRQKDLQEYLEELRAKTPVRTIYDEPTDVARKPE
jgi:parvulin-like peptidyl-prolyl isomerase